MVQGPLTCYTKVQPGLAGSELSILLRWGAGRSRRGERGGGGRAPAMGWGGEEGSLLSNHQAARRDS